MCMQKGLSCISVFPGTLCISGLKLHIQFCRFFLNTEITSFQGYIKTLTAWGCFTSANTDCATVYLNDPPIPGQSRCFQSITIISDAVMSIFVYTCNYFLRLNSSRESNGSDG